MLALPAHDHAAALERVLALVGASADIVAARVESAEPPAWCERRGWSAFLLGLSDDALARCEARGLGACVGGLAAPASLRAFAAEVAASSELPRLAIDPPPLAARTSHGVPLRKRAQVAALLEVCRPLGERAARIVDVGAGRGPLTRAMATRFDKEALGLERAAARVAAAVGLAHATGDRARFRAFDAFREPLELRGDDLALGLHACGELGDVLAGAVARAGCDLALVSCCLQKRSSAERRPLSQRARGLVLRREVLGLSNLVPHEHGVEVSLAATLRAREARHALRLLLQGRGLEAGAGEAMRGINRRAPRRGLGVIATRALALRGLPPPSAHELEQVAARAHTEFSLMRRLSLPRTMLGRALEVAVLLDRASLLAEHGHELRVAELVVPGVTPRNLMLLASRRPR